MINFDANSLALWIGGKWAPKIPTISIKGFSNDSRTISKGGLFIAIETDQRDGHDFLNDALKNGAAAALVSKKMPSRLPQLIVSDPLKAFHRIATVWRQNYTGKVIGITGSCGKTSTKDLLALLLGKRRTHCTEKNFNNHIGVPLTLTGIDPVKHDYVVVEAGINGPGEMDVLSQMIAPDIAIITLVGSAHLEGLGSLERVANEKSKIGLHLKSGGRILYAASCCGFEDFRRYPGRSMVIACDDSDLILENPEEVVPFETKKKRGGYRLKIWRNSSKADCFDIPAWSEGMISNGVLAILTASLLGVSHADIQKRLKRWKATNLRAELIKTKGQSLYLDCYNANPDSYRDAFASFALQDAKKPRFYVLGCMAELGDASRALHVKTGQMLKLRDGDRVAIIGQDSAAFSDGIIAAGADNKQVKTYTKLNSLRSEIASFQGDIFLKGSREYALETLIPQELDIKEVAC